MTATFEHRPDEQQSHIAEMAEILDSKYGGLDDSLPEQALDVTRTVLHSVEGIGEKPEGDEYYAKYRDTASGQIIDGSLIGNLWEKYDKAELLANRRWSPMKTSLGDIAKEGAEAEVQSAHPDTSAEAERQEQGEKPAKENFTIHDTGGTDLERIKRSVENRREEIEARKAKQAGEDENDTVKEQTSTAEGSATTVEPKAEAEESAAVETKPDDGVKNAEEVKKTKDDKKVEDEPSVDTAESDEEQAVEQAAVSGEEPAKDEKSRSRKDRRKGKKGQPAQADSESGDDVQDEVEKNVADDNKQAIGKHAVSGVVTPKPDEDMDFLLDGEIDDFWKQEAANGNIGSAKVQVAQSYEDRKPGQAPVGAEQTDDDDDVDLEEEERIAKAFDRSAVNTFAGSASPTNAEGDKPQVTPLPRWGSERVAGQEKPDKAEEEAVKTTWLGRINALAMVTVTDVREIVRNHPKGAAALGVLSAAAGVAGAAVAYRLGFIPGGGGGVSRDVAMNTDVSQAVATAPPVEAQPVTFGHKANVGEYGTTVWGKIKKDYLDMGLLTGDSKLDNRKIAEILQRTRELNPNINLDKVQPGQEFMMAEFSAPTKVAKVTELAGAAPVGKPAPTAEQLNSFDVLTPNGTNTASDAVWNHLNENGVKLPANQFNVVVEQALKYDARMHEYLGEAVHDPRSMPENYHFYMPPWDELMRYVRDVEEAAESTS